ncbi:hypothetical protein IWX81_001700 [Salinibacterium sp. CAN_S4]|uniref:zeta toxin family protein n=1 Tax=Salinibacterium sp. CAN_S4 TaxID=2787727 RepID=UPI0018F0152F
MPADPAEPLTPDVTDEIYRTLIQPTMFVDSPGGEATPTLVLLGGQPGSGKSRASARLLIEHSGMVAVSGDDLRIYHPYFRDLITDQPERAGAVLADATRPWIRSAIQDSLDERRSLLLEGTFGDPEVTLATAARFRDAGFNIRIVVIASPRTLSLITAASRYLRDRKMSSTARFTSLSAHDRGYDGTTRLIDSLDATGPADRITVISRNGAVLLDRSRPDADAPAPFDDAVRALDEGRNPASWGARSTMELLGELKQVTAYAIASGELTPAIAELLVAAHEHALGDVIPRLSVDPASPQARFIHNAVAEQFVGLRRATHQPEPATSTGGAPVLDPVDRPEPTVN